MPQLFYVGFYYNFFWRLVFGEFFNSLYIATFWTVYIRVFWHFAFPPIVHFL